MKYGYVRVSTREQNIDRQMTAKTFDRPKYQQLVEKLQEGDELFIKSKFVFPPFFIK